MADDFTLTLPNVTLGLRTSHISKSIFWYIGKYLNKVFEECGICQKIGKILYKKDSKKKVLIFLPLNFDTSIPLRCVMTFRRSHTYGRHAPFRVRVH